MWVVIKAVNEYNQVGDYLVCAFDNKPTFEDLKKVLPYESDQTISQLMGGCSEFDGYEIYYLIELQSGQIYLR